MADRYDELYGNHPAGRESSRQSNYGGSRSSDTYGYDDSYGSGMRASDAAGSYLPDNAESDISQYSRSSYVSESARKLRRSAGDEEETAASRYSRSGTTRRSTPKRNAAAQQESEIVQESPRATRRVAAPRQETPQSAASKTRSQERPVQEAAKNAAPAAQEPDMKSHYSRSSASYSAKNPSGKKSKAGIIVAAVLAVVLIGAGVAYAYVSGISSRLHEGVDEDLRAALVHTDMANEPFYVLLLGTDKSNYRESTGETDSIYRTDSMILARIDPVNNKATLVSIPRDTLVDLGGDIGYQRINAAYAYGGPSMTVKAVSNLTGVQISHYAEIDFDGFAAMVDALGGVEVDVPVEIDDPDAGGYVPAGLQTLDGDQALVLCRSRMTYANTSAAPDLVRAANQRLVLSAIAHELLASDVATIAKTVSAIADYVTTDMELNDIIGLAQAMQGLDSENDIYTASFPTESVYVANGYTFADPTSTVSNGTVDPNIDEGYYLLPDEDEWKKMKARMEKGEPPMEGTVIDEGTGIALATAGSDAQDITEKYSTVMVKNATDIQGVATRTAKNLEKAGFQNVVIGEITDNGKYPETLVIYDLPNKAKEADLIVQVMGQGRAMKNDGSYLFDTDFLVIIGDDWQSDSQSSDSAASASSSSGSR